MNKVELHKATLGDEKILAYIQTESWKSAFAEILSPEELERCTDIKKAEAMYQNVLGSHSVHMDIGYVDGTPHCITGWSTSRNDPGKNVAELICIHSLHDRWRQGYGSIILRHVLDEMKEAGYSEVILWVFEKNQNARRFYEKHGFRPSHLSQLSHGAVEIMYERKL